jgi:hypothetical protein
MKKINFVLGISIFVNDIKKQLEDFSIFGFSIE